MFKRIALPAVLLVLAIPTLALAQTPSAAHRSRYLHLYKAVAHKFGSRTPGRNIVRDGLSTGHPVQDADLVQSITVLKRMLAPPPVVPTTSTTYTPAPTYAPSTSYAPSGASGVPACASESGTNYSTGPANTNSSSGATGRYQIIPSTAAGYGCDLSTPAGQDSCAATIYAHQGAGAWVGCGG